MTRCWLPKQRALWWAAMVIVPALATACSAPAQPTTTPPTEAGRLPGSATAAASTAAPSSSSGSPHRVPTIKATTALAPVARFPLCESNAAPDALHRAPSHAVAMGPAGQSYALMATAVDPLADLEDMELGLVKLDSRGKRLWTIELGDLQLHVPAPWPVVVAPNGDVVVAGAFEGTIERGSVRLASAAPSFPFEPEPYVMRIAPDGALRWARRLPHQGPAMSTGLALAADGTAYVAVTSTGPATSTHVMPTDGLGAVYRVDGTGRATVVRRFPGQLRGLVVLGDGKLAIAGSRKGPNAAAFVSQMSATGEILETLDIDATTPLPASPYEDEPTVLALAAAPGGELWMLLSSAYAKGLHIEVVPDGGDPSLLFSLLLVRLDSALRRATVAFQLGGLLYGRPGVLGATADGGVVVGHTQARRTGGFSPSQPAPGWFTRFASADGKLHEVPTIHCSEGMWGHAGLAAATATSRGPSPMTTLQICLRPCEQLCQAYGWCVYRPEDSGMDECVAATADHCAGSAECKRHGSCTPAGTECAASRAADCQASTGCKTHGSCALAPLPHRIATSGCAPANDQHCRRSRACRDEGRCTFTTEPGAAPAENGPRCVARSDATCRRAPICRDAGRCHASRDGDHCEARSAKDCRRSAACRRLGRCSLDPRSSPFVPTGCLALSDGDCARSQICQQQGACSLENQTPGDLGSTLITTCRLQSAADCQRSKACSLHGRCRLVDRQCVQ